MKRWTVILLALVLSGCTTVAGATGGTIQNTAPEKVTVQVYVDNQARVQTEAFERDGVLYLPLETIGEATGRRVDASKGRIDVYLAPARPEIPVVDSGDTAYYRKIFSAMQLLQTKAPEHYQKLIEYAEVIVPGVGNATLPKANVVTIALEDLDKGTTTWIAGTLAHEAEHLRIYHTDRALYANTKENERLAYQAGVEALKLVGAPEREIGWEADKLAELEK